jgi:hypothetical protein
VLYEKISATVEVEKLRAYFLEHVAHHPPQMQRKAFGGWSILSATGKYTDGWQDAAPYHRKTADGKMVFDAARACAEIGHRPPWDHVNPTEVCTGYVREVIEQIARLGLYPRRARWSLLRARSESSLHRDGTDTEYSVRLHIPVITNDKCSFHADGDAVHMPADGSMYLLRVNRLHQIFNHSDEDRIHIIMNVWDTGGVSTTVRAKRQSWMTAAGDQLAKHAHG